jgi:pSer/pThr/pTyr-binding forkhead associated (FHA) protein
MAWLQELDGTRHPLDEAGVTIGRDPSCGVVLLDDPQISRTHATVQLREAQWVLADMGSRNGTWVNDHRVAEHALRDGDRVRLGATTLIYAIGLDPNATEGDRRPAKAAATLSSREEQILRLVAEGLTDRVIAEHLSISTSTVRSHLDRIRDKTGLRRRSELTRFAMGLDLTR